MNLLKKLRGIFAPTPPAPMPAPAAARVATKPSLLARLKARWDEAQQNRDKRPGRYAQHGVGGNIGSRRLVRAMLRAEKWDCRRSRLRRNPHGGPWAKEALRPLGVA